MNKLPLQPPAIEMPPLPPRVPVWEIHRALWQLEQDLWEGLPPGDVFFRDVSALPEDRRQLLEAIRRLRAAQLAFERVVELQLEVERLRPEAERLMAKPWDSLNVEEDALLELYGQMRAVLDGRTSYVLES